jgi:hypothetical protein
MSDKANRIIDGYLQLPLFYRGDVIGDTVSLANAKYVQQLAKQERIKIKVCKLKEVRQIAQGVNPPSIMLAYDMYLTSALFFHIKRLQAKHPNFWGKIEKLERGQVLDKDLRQEMERDAALEAWASNPEVKRTVAAMITQTQMISREKAWKIIEEYWDSDEQTFRHFQDPNTLTAAYNVDADLSVQIKTDLSDPLTETCYVNVMLHLLYKASEAKYREFGDYYEG